MTTEAHYSKISSTFRLQKLHEVFVGGWNQGTYNDKKTYLDLWSNIQMVHKSLDTVYLPTEGLC